MPVCGAVDRLADTAERTHGRTARVGAVQDGAYLSRSAACTTRDRLRSPCAAAGVCACRTSPRASAHRIPDDCKASAVYSPRAITSVAEQTKEPGPATNTLMCLSLAPALKALAPTDVDPMFGFAETAEDDQISRRRVRLDLEQLFIAAAGRALEEPVFHC